MDGVTATTIFDVDGTVALPAAVESPQNDDVFFQHADQFLGPGGEFLEIVPGLQEFPAEVRDVRRETGFHPASGLRRRGGGFL